MVKGGVYQTDSFPQPKQHQNLNGMEHIFFIFKLIRINVAHPTASEMKITGCQYSPLQCVHIRRLPQL